MPIEAKLHAPGARPEWMERSGLVGQLNGTTARLILVDAPAGFGKTILIAQWRASLAGSLPFAWVSLDRGDDDPGRLWWYVVTALQRACPRFGGEAILAELRVQAPDFTGLVLPLLANELAALPAPVVLVLDDYHVIKERSCHEQIAFLLSHLPPTAQIVLITRADPALPLARLRASGQMTEFRASGLRFTAAEVAALVHAVSGFQLSKPDLADLVERTEGWPAGVYLAALSLRGRSSPHAFVREFTGDNRFIFDFLVEEVLGRQPAEVQQFLMRTSVLGRFCAPLCEAVTGSAGAAGIIERLERENLFIVPLDESRQWFRYHHLLAQVLRGYLARTEPAIVPALHRRASAWHAEHGPADEAISHAIAAGDPDLATDVAVGAVLAAEGRLDEARGELMQALSYRERAPGTSPWPTLEATIRLAQVLLEAGDRAGAASLTTQAREVLTTLPGGMGAQQARLMALERQLAGPHREAPPAAPLTEREIAVLHLLGGTLSLREIGQELFVSANTVKTHTQAIYRKLGVSSRTEAVEHGRELGI